jgi:hypothetical protein
VFFFFLLADTIILPTKQKTIVNSFKFVLNTQLVVRDIFQKKKKSNKRYFNRIKRANLTLSDYKVGLGISKMIFNQNKPISSLIFYMLYLLLDALEKTIRVVFKLIF